MDKIVPDSILYLLNKRPTRRPSPPPPTPQPQLQQVPQLAQLPQLQQLPQLPQLPPQSQPQQPATPELPIPPSTPISPTPINPVQPVPNPTPVQPRHPIITFYPHRAASQNGNPASSTPAPLSYDSTSGNRRLINMVRIPLKPRPTIPPSDAVPLGALPLNGESKTESLSPVPDDSKDKSPIPVKPSDSLSGENNSKDTESTVTFNPQDLPVDSINNIEASPIPVRPRNDDTDDKEELVAVPIDGKNPTPIPSEPVYDSVNDTDESGDDKDTPKNNESSDKNISSDQQNGDDEEKETPKQNASESSQAKSVDENDSDNPNNELSESDSDSDRAETFDGQPDDSNSADKPKKANSEKSENPLKDLVLNGKDIENINIFTLYNAHYLNLSAYMTISMLLSNNKNIE